MLTSKVCNVSQMEGDAVEAVMADAEQLAAMLQPIYKELQVRHFAGVLPPWCANHAGCLRRVFLVCHTLWHNAAVSFHSTATQDQLSI